jgi:acetyl esterase/lipase
MDKLTILIILVFIHAIVAAQPPQADTSFTTYSAYFKAIKTNPNIAIVQEIYSPQIAEQKSIAYCSIGERKLLLDVFYPAEKQKSNGIAIIIIHGGGWRSGNRAQHYPLAQQLALLGYTCYTPEYRLSGEALYPAAITDINTSIQWVKKNADTYNVDTTKITALGFSAGGEIAAFVGNTAGIAAFENANCNTETSSTVNAIIDIDGTLSFVHPESSEGNDSKKLSAATQWFGVAKKDSFSLWQQASPLQYAGKHSPPTLFINSSVAAMHAGREDYISILLQHNITTAVHNLLSAPHTFCLFHPWFEPTVKYVDDFLRKIFK